MDGNVLPLIFFIVLSSVQSSLASTSDRRINHGLVGYGIVMFDPPCAYACKDVVSPSPLNCTPHEHHSADHAHGHVSTPPECFATDDAFLQTMAYCLSINCDGVSPWLLEYFWSRDLVGSTLSIRYRGTGTKHVFQEAITCQSRKTPFKRRWRRSQHLQP